MLICGTCQKVYLCGRRICCGGLRLLRGGVGLMLRFSSLSLRPRLGSLQVVRLLLPQLPALGQHLEGQEGHHQEEHSHNEVVRD